MPFLIILFLVISMEVLGQTPSPVIYAHATKAFIREGNEDKTGWTLSPEIKPDVYATSKITQATRIQFYTDIDSIQFLIQPNQVIDFLVILNEKDSCFTRIESPALKNYSSIFPEIHDTIPFVLTEYNNIVLKVLMDGQDTLNLKYDSGTTDFLLTNDVIKNKLQLKSLQNHSFQIGNQHWDRQLIYPVALSGHGTVGRFGWNLFDGMILEIDYDKSLMMIHSTMPKLSKQYAKFEMEYTNGLICIRGALQIKGEKFKNRFLFDNGYQRTIMLDNALMVEQQYPKDRLPVLKKVIMKNGQGTEIPVLTVNNEQLHLGKHTLKNIPVQLLSGSNPARFKTHILGNEVLKRFNTIMDFQENLLYLKPNSLKDMPYDLEK